MPRSKIIVSPVSAQTPTQKGRAGHRTRSDGLRSRQAILLAAARLATLRGFASLSIGDLASELGMSKSGLFAHFGSKEQLELATIEAAEKIFIEDVVAPTLRAKPGLPRLHALVEAYCAHVERRVFPGGCFFAAVSAEVEKRPGPGRDRLVKFITEWFGLIERCLREARERGEIAPDSDPAQLAFEADAMIAMANAMFVLGQDAAVFDRAKAGVEHVLDRVRVPHA